VQGQLVGEIAPFGHLDRVDLADQIGDRGVGRGQLLAVALGAVEPLDGGLVTLVSDPQPGETRRRVVGVVVDLRATHDRQPLVEQADQGADQAGLGLAALTQQDDIVARQEGVLELGDDGVLEPEHPRHHRLAGGHPGCGVAPQFLGHGDRHPTRFSECAQCPWKITRGMGAWAVEWCALGAGGQP